jgi:hypothetical protein
MLVIVCYMCQGKEGGKERERDTLQIHRLCMTGLRRETPIYPKNKKKVNCISARWKDITLTSYDIRQQFKVTDTEF